MNSHGWIIELVLREPIHRGRGAYFVLPILSSINYVNLSFFHVATIISVILKLRLKQDVTSSIYTSFYLDAKETKLLILMNKIY